MFRRDFDSAKNWAANKPDACALMQKEILHYASVMLAPGGRLVYSTCTFAEAEDEDVITEFLRTHDGFSLLPIDCEGLGISTAEVCEVSIRTETEGLSENLQGKAVGILPEEATQGKTGDRLPEEATQDKTRYSLSEEVTQDKTVDRLSKEATQLKTAHSTTLPKSTLPTAARIWPHKANGEGHFTALLEKANSSSKYIPPERNRRSVSGMAFVTPDAFKEFCTEHLSAEAATFLLSGSFIINGVSLYRVPEGLPDLRGLRIARSGWYMGDISKGRYTPSQALAMGLTQNDANTAVDLSNDDAMRYLRGESITPEGDALAALEPLTGKPWVLVCCIGYPLGWARWVNGRLKNYLPAGWVEN
jgi:NOL1/NOP2/fmu family ribosome biogenesis protein